MAKDPAFLFYYQDFLVGTMFMSNEETGMYIKILCHMADKGPLNKEDMKNICNSYDNHTYLKSKFKVDKEGNFYNERLLKEVEKRKNYIQSRSKNRLSYVNHMENENENENNKERVVKGKQNDRFEDIWAKYPNKDGKKAAQKHFEAGVVTDQDWLDINKALTNYLQSKKVLEGYIKNGSTWFNNWRDWVNFTGEAQLDPKQQFKQKWQKKD